MSRHEEELMSRVLENKFVWNDLRYLLEMNYIEKSAYEGQFGVTSYTVLKEFSMGRFEYQKGDTLLD